MHHGQKAVELIRDLARATDSIPPYNVFSFLHFFLVTFACRKMPQDK